MNVLIDNQNLEDFDLICTEFTVSSPSIKTHTINIPGRDGTIDLSEVVSGRVNFENRDLSAKFIKKGKTVNFATLNNQLLTNFQGKVCKFTNSSDSDFYYLGRCFIDVIQSSYNVIEVFLQSSVEPFKYKNNITSLTVAANNSGKEQIFENLYSIAKPIFITQSSNMSVSSDGTIYSLSTGTNKIPGIVFQKGENTLTFTGSGSVKVQWQEGII